MHLVHEKIVASLQRALAKVPSAAEVIVGAWLGVFLVYKVASATCQPHTKIVFQRLRPFGRERDFLTMFSLLLKDSGVEIVYDLLEKKGFERADVC